MPVLFEIPPSLHANKSRRVLWMCETWPTEAPEWWQPDLSIDLLCLQSEPAHWNEKSRERLCKRLKLNRVLSWNGRSGFKRGEDGLLRLDWPVGLGNEELRRAFRDWLSETHWDAAVIEGLHAASPLLGDHGLEVPRSLSWIVYRGKSAELEAWSQAITKKPFAFSLGARFTRWRLSKIEDSILRRAAFVVAPKMSSKASQEKPAQPTEGGGRMAA